MTGRTCRDDILAALDRLEQRSGRREFAVAEPDPWRGLVVAEAISRSCGTAFSYDHGGGFVFHLLRCDACGAERAEAFRELGHLHGRWLKSFDGPYAIATAAADQAQREATPGEPLRDEDYHRAVEAHAGPCGCGGRFRFDAPARCPRCRSTDLDAQVVARYD